jgi:hypothetical protein
MNVVVNVLVIIFLLLIIFFIVRMFQTNWNIIKIFDFSYQPYQYDYSVYNESLNGQNIKKAYVSMTTIPERLQDKWFYNNLKRNISLPGNFIIVLNVPYVSLKGVEYIIPNYIHALEGDKFIINRCDDEGPITKLLPTLRNTNIPDDSHIIIVDDDIVYKKNIFQVLNTGIHKYPPKVVSMCNDNNPIEGFKGFGFVKKTLMGLLDVNIPKSCIRIDDDVISTYIKHNNISIVVLPYDRGTSGFCTMYRGDTDTHPKWDELGQDNRSPMQKQCISELHKQMFNKKY